MSCCVFVGFRIIRFYFFKRNISLTKRYINSDDDLDYWTFGHLDYWTIGHCPIQVQFSIRQNELCPITTKFDFLI